MKIRHRKKRLQRQRRRRSNFVRDTLQVLAEAKAGLLAPYVFGTEDYAWQDTQPVGREIGTSRV